ncbi:MAG: WbqC family protein [Bacteroidota bacterium]|jgi:hypothetical protein
MSKRVAIMQPYFLPYLGYFQLINAVDEFVVYDKIKYTKKGWINRNRINVNGEPHYITISLKSASDFLNINERELSDQWEKDRLKILNTIAGVYSGALYFKEVFPLIQEIVLAQEKNLFGFLYNSLLLMREFLEMKNQFTISSSLSFDDSLQSSEKVKAICKACKADIYINAIGGTELYDRSDFKSGGIELFFLKSDEVVYPQVFPGFVSHLSILDVLMNIGKAETQRLIKNSYSLK